MASVVAGGLFNAIAFAGADTCFTSWTKAVKKPKWNDITKQWKSLTEKKKNGTKER